MRRDKGDTIVEVMFGFVVFSMLAVASYMVMNRGTQIAQRSLEITLVRQQLDAQIALIKYIKETDQTTWDAIVAEKLIDNPIEIAAAGQDGCPAPDGTTELNSARKAFFVAADSSKTTIRPVAVDSTTFGTPSVYASVDIAAGRTYGIFAQVSRAETATGSTAGKAYDVYVNACWDSVGTNAPLTVGTVTRLYDR